MTVKGYEGPPNCIAGDGTVGFEGPTPGMCSSWANLSLPPVPIGPRPPPMALDVPRDGAPWWVWIGSAAGALGAYHGYRRTGSWGWAFGWGVFAGLLPFLAVPVAFAQGFGKPEGKRANPGRWRRRRGRR